MLNKKLLTMCSGLALSLMASCGEAEIVVPSVLGIVSTQPSNGAVNIVTRELSVAFSAPIDNQADYASHFTLSQIGGSQQVNLSASLAQDNQMVLLSTDRDLLGGSRYELTVKKGIKSADENIEPLPVDVAVQFMTANQNN